MIDKATQPTGAVLPIFEERAVLDKEVRETGRVQVSTHVEEHQARFQEALRREDVAVERVAVNQVVDEAPAIRQEGDTTIYPIVEETFVVIKRFLVKEELRVTRVTSIETIGQEVTLRAMHADVRRIPTV